MPDDDQKISGSKNAEEALDPVFSSLAAEQNITEEDWNLFNRLTSVELDDREKAMAVSPGRTAPGETELLAVHWHPEWVPMNLIGERLEASFPDAANSLIIPTQHNKVMTFGPWAGVEADAYDRQYGQKVQLLIHFRADRLDRAGTFIGMMERTYNYRAHQLLDILSRLAEPDEVSSRVWSSLSCSIPSESLRMARFYAIRLRALIEMSGILGSERDEMLKNRLLSDFMLRRVCRRHSVLLEQAMVFINAIKRSVKAELSPDAFYSPQEIIEEARSFGAGVVIPHPPVFWPILLSDLDVDGWEVWNSSTPSHTVFLTEALSRANQIQRKRPLLVFMGDDTHMSAKIRLPVSDQKGSASREIGFQDPWFSQPVRDALNKTNQSRTNTINEYRDRLLNG
ncbi:hypothetical protein C4J81_15775 [Deltaproteobacteria bacterium Smac51]|nr:hypothetical protein C4J81_15775 [Deltaproteobacteria bacterium Smac51]